MIRASHQGENNTTSVWKGAKPVVVEFTKDTDQFVSDDLERPGETRSYGPYKAGNLAILPKLDAQAFISRCSAYEVEWSRYSKVLTEFGVKYADRAGPKIFKNKTEFQEIIREMVKRLEAEGEPVVPTKMGRVLKIDPGRIMMILKEDGYKHIFESDCDGYPIYRKEAV